MSYNDWHREAALEADGLAIRIAVSFANDGFVRDQPGIGERMKRVRVTVYDAADPRRATRFATMCEGDARFCGDPR